jgi:hypothetical protein
VRSIPQSNKYLAPRNGRPMPADERANDLFHWQTRLAAPDLGAAVQRLRQSHSPFISPAAVEIPGGALGFHRGLMVRDPDGHPFQLVSD